MTVSTRYLLEVLPPNVSVHPTVATATGTAYTVETVFPIETDTVAGTATLEAPTFPLASPDTVADVATVPTPTIAGVTLASPITVDATASVGAPVVGTLVSVATINAVASVAGLGYTDSFNRADSALTMGSTGSAYGGTNVAWTPVTAGSIWGISSNQARLVTSGTGQDLTAIETGLADCTVEVTFSVGGACSPCWRVSDDNNNWVIDGANNPPIVYKRAGGGFTSVTPFSDAGALTAGDIVKIVLSGNTHTIYRNDVQVAAYSDAFNATATKHGLRSAGSTTPRFEDFKVLTSGIAVTIFSRPTPGTVRATVTMTPPAIHANVTGHVSTTPRWSLRDPDTGQLYEFDINPSQQDYQPYSKNISYKNTLPNKSIIYEVQKDATSISWSGTVLLEGQLAALQVWFDNRAVVTLTDDLGREFDIYITEFTPKRVRNVQYPWYHTYDMKALVVS